MITSIVSLNDTFCTDESTMEWIWDTSHTGLRPDCPSANIWLGGNTDYMYNSISAVKEACEVHPTCNFFQRYDGGGSDEEDCDTCFAHNYAHSCPDLDDIRWINESRWGEGAWNTNNYQLHCVDDGGDVNTTQPTSNPTFAPRVCPDETPLYWRYDTSHTGKRPNCPTVNIWGGGGYMWHSIKVVKGSCAAHPTCNFIQRYDGGGQDKENCDDCYGHNYVHYCPDLKNISWSTETRWGIGADTANNYQLGCDGQFGDISSEEDTIPTWVWVVIVIAIVSCICCIICYRCMNGSDIISYGSDKGNLEAPNEDKKTPGSTNGETQEITPGNNDERGEGEATSFVMTYS